MSEVSKTRIDLVVKDLKEKSVADSLCGTAATAAVPACYCLLVSYCTAVALCYCALLISSCEVAVRVG